MDVYLVYTVELFKKKEIIDIIKNSPYPINILDSFYYKTLDIKEALPFIDRLIIDSGAFTLQKQDKINHLDKYVHDYIKFIDKWSSQNKVTGFFEMDVDNVIGYDAVKDIREQLFEVSNKIIPVWHKSLGLTEFKNMCKEYDYISVSCVGNRDIPQDKYGLFVKEAHKHNCKIHGLGQSTKKVLDKVPFDTVDSSSWYKTPRFGRYKNKKINSDYLKKNYWKFWPIDFLEGLKFAEHYNKKWRFLHE